MKHKVWILFFLGYSCVTKLILAASLVRQQAGLHGMITQNLGAQEEPSLPLELPEQFAMTTEKFLRMQGKVRQLRLLICHYYNLQVPSEPTLSSLRFDDVVFSETMVDYLVYGTKLLYRPASRMRGRKKRDLINFVTRPEAKWPGGYVPFVSQYSGGTMLAAQIQTAMDLWHQETCIRFYRLNRTHDGRPDYLNITDDFYGCYAEIGRKNQQQIMNLGFTCGNSVGVILHELAHVLGFFHEQARFDRDLYVDVLTENFSPDQAFNFVKLDASQIETFFTPYDFASIMQYSSRALSKDPVNLRTLVTRDPLYQSSLGQRESLSFFDVKAANLAYCSQLCDQTSLPCQQGGYPDPNDCGKCKCPDGFRGQTCGQIQDSSGVCPLPGVLQATFREQCLTVGPYSGGVSCTWLIKAQTNCGGVKVWFKDPFDLLCREFEPACVHYVEVRYNNNLGGVGPRFCCKERPSAVLQSDGSHDVLILFRSPSDNTDTHQGFTVCYSLYSCHGSTPPLPGFSTTSAPRAALLTTLARPVATISRQTATSHATSNNSPLLATTSSQARKTTRNPTFRTTSSSPRTTLRNLFTTSHNVFTTSNPYRTANPFLTTRTSPARSTTRRFPTTSYYPYTTNTNLNMFPTIRFPAQTTTARRATNTF